MKPISDEMRKLAEDYDVLPLYGLADRIDSEMVELPRGKDGVPIHVGDTVWGCVSGMQMVVRELKLTDRWIISTDMGFLPIASVVTHARPDSLDRIADKLEKWCNKVHMDRGLKLRCLVSRIRRMAGKEGE